MDLYRMLAGVLQGTILTLLTLPGLAQTLGSIQGTVLDEHGHHVKAGIRVMAGPMAAWMGPIPQADTDEYGNFRFSRLLLISWALYVAHEEPGQWGHNDFYGDTVKVDLTPNAPTANNVIVRITARPAVLEGEVNDASTGRPVRSVFFLERARGYLQESVGSTYRIVLPSNNDIRLMVRAEGYKPWTSPQIVNLRPGHHLRLNIRLNPRSTREARSVSR